MARYVYISGPLQAADDLCAARAFYERLAKLCEREGVDVYLPHISTDPVQNRDVPVEAVFSRDVSFVRSAAAIVACVGQPSSGVGAELGIASELGIPILALWHEDERPSRFLEGLLRSSGRGCCLTFADEADLEEKFPEALRAIVNVERM